MVPILKLVANRIYAYTGALTPAEYLGPILIKGVSFELFKIGDRSLYFYPSEVDGFFSEFPRL